MAEGHDAPGRPQNLKVMIKHLHFILTLLLAMFFTASWAETTVTFDAKADKFGTKDPGANITGTKDGVTLTLTNGVMGNGKEYRIYKGEKLTISSTAGNITKVVFTCTVDNDTKYGPGCFGTPGVGSYTFEGKVGTWTGSATSVDFTASSYQVRATKIEVTLGGTAGPTKKSAGLAFSKSNISLSKDDISKFEAPTFTKATTADVTFTTTGNGVATVSSEGVISLTGAMGRDTIKATSAENDEYAAGSAQVVINVFGYNFYKKATTLVSGNKYLLGYEINADSVFYAYPISASENHGYLTGKKVKLNSNGEIGVRTDYDDYFTIIADENADAGQYNIVQPDGRKLYLDGEHASFNVAKEPKSGFVWTISLDANGNATIQNTSNNKYMIYQVYNGKPEFTTSAIADALPVLYTLDETATKITGISERKAVNSDATYNLAGQRVSKDYKGVVIRNGKKFINK